MRKVENGDRIDAWLIGSIRDDRFLAISTVALTLQLADSRGSLCSPKAGFGRIRLLPRRAAYGLSCELTQPAMSCRLRCPTLLPLQTGCRRSSSAWRMTAVAYSGR